MTVPPLTREERKWARRLERVLSECPDRLELVTVGDSSLQVIDRDGARLSELADGAAERDGVVLYTIIGKPKVHGVSG